MQETNSKHRLMSDLDLQKQIHGLLRIQTNIYEAVDFFIPELIINGLLNNNNEFTFDYSKVEPVASWFNYLPT